MSELSASQQVDAIIKMHPGWKAAILSDIRAVVTSADPEIVEEIKWRMKTRPEGLAVWVKDGNICYAEIWKDNIKLIFPKGASLSDPDKLFNARLKSKDLRAIEFREGDNIDMSALKALTLKATELQSHQ